MESIPFFLIIRLLIGLSAGFWLAHKMRGFFRWLVLRLMPIRYRISEQAFNMQARISAALAYLLALSVAAFIYVGLGKAGAQVGLPWISKEESTEVRSSSMEPTLPIAYSTPDYSLPEEPVLSADSLPPPAITSPEPEPAARPGRSTSYPRAYMNSSRYFVQLYAFRNEERAWAQKQYWEGRLSERVWVGVAAGDAVPYKVLVGPFGQWQEARQYLRSQRLDGFPREQKDIRLFED